MTGFDLIAYGTVSVIALVAAGAIIPNPFRDKIRETLSILTFGLLDGMTTELQRAKRRLAVLQAEIAEGQRTASDMRGTVNHHKNNILKRLEKELTEAEADYALAVDRKLGTEVENDMLDKVAAAETAVAEEKVNIEVLQKAADETRLAIAKAAKEVQKLARTVAAKEVRESATKILDTAGRILQETKDVGNATSEIGRDLDKIDEKYEQAKARFEDSQGSEAERKLEEAKAQRSREDILKRMQERRAAGQK
ncbi:MAG: hypothetical protein K2X77_33465 [Candidatus Obscuribacterales bacterium]|nr:hypothetical protein [Candidatus Obscuribacterales bacterium]